jgi:uncharacterized protein YbjT (DUF2867 family)
MTYTITGATGKVGSQIVRALLSRKEDVRAVGRNTERLAELEGLGGSVFKGDLTDVSFLTDAFKGADRVFTIVGSDMQAKNLRESQNRMGEAEAKALAEAGVTHLVNLSSLGAHLPGGTGPILGLRDQEQRINGMKGIHVVHLRPTYFMENLLSNVELIKHQGIMGGVVKKDVPFPVIAARDVAGAAVEALTGPDFSGKTVREYLGQRDLTMEEMTRIIGEAIGKPSLSYVEFSEEDTRNAMAAMGLSEDVARSFVEMGVAISEGTLKGETARSAENTTETSFEEFAKTFALFYKG